MEGLESGRLDAALANPLSHPALDTEVLFEDRWACARCQEAADGPLDLPAYLRLPHLLVSPLGQPGSVVGRALEPAYGFRSLATFKSRFKPDYRTLYLYYQDPLQLPAMGRALSRAYLPDLSVRQSARLLRTLVR